MDAAEDFLAGTLERADLNQSTSQHKQQQQHMKLV